MCIFQNIAPIEWRFITSTFDLKGSTYDRQVIKTENFEELWSKKTLKDVDFIKYEKSVKINKKTIKKCLKIIKEDVLFLQSQGFMDYSLIIFKINWADYYTENMLTQRI